IWEGGTPVEGLDEQRQALSLVQFWFAKRLPPDAVLTRIRGDATLGDAVRHRALALVEPFERGRVRAEAESQVRALFNKPLFRSEVLAHLRADTALRAPVRQEALALADRYVENPTVLNQASRAVVRQPGADPAACGRALRQAELACGLLPFEGAYHT